MNPTRFSIDSVDRFTSNRTHAGAPGQRAVRADPEAPKTKENLKRCSIATAIRFESNRTHVPALGQGTIRADPKAQITKENLNRFSIATAIRRKSNRIHALASRLRAIRPDLVTLLKLSLLSVVALAATEDLPKKIKCKKVKIVNQTQLLRDQLSKSLFGKRKSKGSIKDYKEICYNTITNSLHDGKNGMAIDIRFPINPKELRYLQHTEYLGEDNKEIEKKRQDTKTGYMILLTDKAGDEWQIEFNKKSSDTVSEDLWNHMRIVNEIKYAREMKKIAAAERERLERAKRERLENPTIIALKLNEEKAPKWNEICTIQKAYWGASGEHYQQIRSRGGYTKNIGWIVPLQSISQPEDNILEVTDLDGKKYRLKFKAEDILAFWYDLIKGHLERAAKPSEPSEARSGSEYLDKDSLELGTAPDHVGKKPGDEDGPEDDLLRPEDSLLDSDEARKVDSAPEFERKKQGDGDGSEEISRVAAAEEEIPAAYLYPPKDEKFLDDKECTSL